MLAVESACWAKTPTEFKQHEAEATRLYGEGKFDESIVELQAAYRISPAPWLLINIGRCHIKANRPQEALDAYNQALKGKLDGEEQQALLRSISSAILMRDKQRDDERRAAEQRAAVVAQEKALVAQSLSAAPENKPLYKKAWFWGTVGGIVAVGLGVGLTVGLLSRNNAPTATSPPMMPADGSPAF